MVLLLSSPVLTTLVSPLAWLLSGLFPRPHPHPPVELCVLFPACRAVSAQVVCKEQPVSMVPSPHGCLSLCLLLELAQRVMIERVESVTAIPAQASRMYAARDRAFDVWMTCEVQPW